MRTIDPNEADTKEFYGLLVGAVGPRPIAFASTIDAQGRANLSPYSFFNAFSSNPPVLVFSSARRVRDNTTKDTLHNIEATRQVVINIVNYAIVQQMSLSSTEYEPGVDEFLKSGLTKVASELVKPFRVKESPVQMECEVEQIISLGNEGGAGNLFLCKVVKMHIDESILDEESKIDQHKIDQVARMGGNWYTRANMGMFEVLKPLRSQGMGVDALPQSIRESKILTGNDLGKLGNLKKLPNSEEIDHFLAENGHLKSLIESGNKERIHISAQELLYGDKAEDALKLLLAAQY